MKYLTSAAIFAIATIGSTGSAMAWEKTWSGYAWDKGCEGYVCFAPYTAYKNGHYGHLRCKDPHKYLTYVGHKLKCVPRGYKAK